MSIMSALITVGVVAYVVGFIAYWKGRYHGVQAERKRWTSVMSGKGPID